jgi:hypothetical protein
LAQIQYVDYRREDKDAFKAFAKALAALPTSVPLPDPLPEAPPAPVSYLGSLREQLEAQPGVTFAQQTELVLRLKNGLRSAKDAEQVRRLLALFRSRDDLYAKVADEIDALLVDLPVVAAPPSHSDAESTPATDEKVRDPAKSHVKGNDPDYLVRSDSREHKLDGADISSFHLFSFQHFWLSVSGGLLVSVALGAATVNVIDKRFVPLANRVDTPGIIEAAFWSIPAAITFLAIVVWGKLSSRSVYLKFTFVFLPLFAGFLIPIYAPIYEQDSLQYWTFFQLKLLMALIPLALVAALLDWFTVSLKLLWSVLMCGFVFSGVISQFWRTWLRWGPILRLLSWVLAAAFLLFLFVLVLKRLSSYVIGRKKLQ